MTTNTKLDDAACLVTWEDSCIPELQHGNRICRKPPCSRKINPPEQNRSASDRRARRLPFAQVPSKIGSMELSGKPLSLEQIADVAYGREPVQIAASVRPRILASRKVVDDIVTREAGVYGVNTGFGKFTDVRSPRDEIGTLQLNLVRSHACGIGSPLSEPEVRAMMLLRANVLTLGFSGIRPEVIQLLCEMLNHRVHPIFPEKGSLGASGDLAPPAHP